MLTITPANKELAKRKAVRIIRSSESDIDLDKQIMRLECSSFCSDRILSIVLRSMTSGCSLKKASKAYQKATREHLRFTYAER